MKFISHAIAEAEERPEAVRVQKAAEEKNYQGEAKWERLLLKEG